MKRVLNKFLYLFFQKQQEISMGMEQRIDEMAAREKRLYADQEQKIALKDNQISALVGQVDQLEQVNSFQSKIILGILIKVNR